MNATWGTKPYTTSSKLWKKKPGCSLKPGLKSPQTCKQCVRRSLYIILGSATSRISQVVKSQDVQTQRVARKSMCTRSESLYVLLFGVKGCLNVYGWLLSLFRCHFFQYLVIFWVHCSHRGLSVCLSSGFMLFWCCFWFLGIRLYGRGEVYFPQQAREELCCDNQSLTATAHLLPRVLSFGRDTEIHGW